jgi:RNA polymerase sigma factor (sigma-70 family)
VPAPDPGFAETLAAAQGGSPEAFRALYESLAPVVAATLRGRGARDVDDLVSETFLDVFRSLPRFRGGSADLRAWTLTIAHRRHADALRRSAREVPRAHAEVPEDAATAPSAEELGLDRAATDRVRALLDRLAPDQRDVLVLRVLGDLTIEQIADVLGKRVGAVKALQRRGLAALRRLVADPSEDTPR